MMLKTINNIALVSSAFLLMSCFGQRVHQWSVGDNQARSELDEKFQTDDDGQRLRSSHVSAVLGATVTCNYGAHYV